jgi:DNA-binding CsgD family transcriptional regulator
MDPERIARLTDKQRECLRLVYAHLSSKEIAPRLGVEPGTVDQYIKAAMRVLGVSDRRAAARMLAEYERMFHSQLAMREEQAPFDADSPDEAAEPRFAFPIPGTKPEKLGPLQRLIWIFAIMMAMALVFGVFIAGVEALSRIGRGVGG